MMATKKTIRLVQGVVFKRALATKIPNKLYSKTCTILSVSGNCSGTCTFGKPETRKIIAE